MNSSRPEKRLIGRLLAFLKRRLIQNILTLYGIHFANYLLPLITVPYLARVLGPSAWGLLAFTQAFSRYVVIVVEYGFHLAGTREVARNRDSREALAEIVQGIWGAKGLLALAGLGLALVIQRFVPNFKDYPALVWAGMFWAIPQSFRLIWFFQGLERMRQVAALDIGAKILATAGIFIFIRTSEQAHYVLLMHGFGALFSVAAGSWLMYREIPFRWPTLQPALKALKMGWTLFIFRSAVSLYTVSNTFILGLFVSPTLVGYYAGAEKISKAFLGLLSPVSQALYPRLSHLVQHEREKATRLAQKGVAVMGGGGLLLGLMVFLLAPQLINILLGPKFENAVPVLHVLAMLPPVIALSNVLGIQWMLPLGLDRTFNGIILQAGILNIGMAVTLVSLYGYMGMAWAVVSVETFVTISVYLRLRLRRMDPFSMVVVSKAESR